MSGGAIMFIWVYQLTDAMVVVWWIHLFCQVIREELKCTS